MDGASRHAHRLASNFLEELDTMQRTSRARDRRAMSHLEIGTRTGNWFPEEALKSDRRRSLTYGSTSSLTATPVYFRPHHQHRPHYPQRIVSYQAPTIMMVGKSIGPSAPRYTPTNELYQDPQYGSMDLPTSSLHAHPPVRRHIMTPRALDYVNHKLSSWRRASSLFDLYSDDFEEPVSRVVHKTYTRRPPIASARLGSVPPISTYRPVYYTSEITTPTISTPRTYYRTTRYISESPYYLSSYSNRTAEPSRPILTTHYSTAPAPITQRYTYYYPSVITGKRYFSPVRTSSYVNLTPEVQYERRRIERRMDDLLDYKLPPPDYYRAMRGSLRGLHDKLDEHRRLLDRYSGVDMDSTVSSVGDRIESKYQQLANRVTARA